MITCTNCGHANPEGAITCEACYVELPKMTSCPSCHAQVPEDAVFCSQCGASLQPGVAAPGLDMATAPTQVNAGKGIPATDVVNFETPSGIPATDVVVPLPDPPAMAPPDPVEMTEFPDMDLGYAPTEVTPPGSLPPPLAVEMSEQPTENVIPPSSLPTPPELDFEEPTPPMPPAASQPPMPPVSEPPMPPAASQPPMPPMEFTPPSPAPEAPPTPPEPVVSAAPQPTTTPIPEQPKPMPVGATQLQLPVARLLHERSNSNLDLPTNLNLVHIGKPNDRIPPDIDVSGFPDSDVVSRVHADIRVEPDGYYIEDTGSANGTYVNNQPLRPGDRYRLRAGDRISLGKEDKVSFIFHPG
ncbi:FHA domain-containing protein [Acaryochloris sp. CCMEE 5410]|uniref:FHA domain-containing protein n=1 Tax=Acaryochloris sp. CCMEE 5410 TaxID=310037 RepID=UPI0002484694|nr:FHA domain-containing protein [Acaryochloris sp. CCMEE 5410]KAI9134287.1 FHA domain-containing protein [Acaryochloris sp. CCMEE 5410]